MHAFLKNPVVVVACGALVVFLSMGTRQSFGLFLQPVSTALSTGRETFSLAIAFQNLIFGLPLAGILADRFGARGVAAGGGIIYAAGLLMLAYLAGRFGLYLNLGLMAGLALSATSYVVVLGATARAVPPEKRTAAFGVITAAGSMGMFAVVPGVQWVISNYGWRGAVMALSAGVGVIVLLAVGLPGRKATAASGDPVLESEYGLPEMLSCARRHSGYYLLNAGFFVCGFHVAFIATHLPAFLNDNKVSAMAGATALAMIGFANIFGSYLSGYLGDRFRKKYLLSLLYISRAVVISLFLIFPITNVSAVIFGTMIGFLWLATIPLTSGMVAQIFGTRYLSSLYGIVFLSHQIGSFLGVWLGGRVYDLTGSYTSVWLVAIGLGFTAAILHLPISDTQLCLRKPSAVTS